MSEVGAAISMATKVLDLIAAYQAKEISREELNRRIAELPDPKPPKEKDDGA